MPPPRRGGALPDELRDTDACAGPLGASRTPNTLSRLLGLNEATLPGFVHEGELVVGQGIEPCRRSPSGRSPGLIGPSRTPVLPTDRSWSPAQGSNLLPLDYRSNAHPYELAGAQTVVPDHSTIPLRGCSCTGCDGGTRSHTFGLMRTALLPLKLRRKDRGAPGSTRTSVCGASIRRYCLLSYECKTWSSRSGSNRRSPAYKADALASSATGAERVVNAGADSGIRIRGLDLGTVALLHLSYARNRSGNPARIRAADCGFGDRRVSSYTTGLWPGTPYRY
jgi:hypothetical protein